jgi:hypothetical protein
LFRVEPDPDLALAVLNANGKLLTCDVNLAYRGDGPDPFTFTYEGNDPCFVELA